MSTQFLICFWMGAAVLFSFFFFFLSQKLWYGLNAILPLSCQSTSLCLGDKVRQLSEWLFGGCFDWHLALEQQKSATRFPRDTTCLAQGTFVRSIFISLLLSQPISPGHSVRHHLSLTVKLSRVCVRACVRLSVPVFPRRLGPGRRRVSYGCPKDNPQSGLWRNERRRWMFSEHRRISLKLPVPALDWFAESQRLDVNIKPANGFNLNMLLINTPQSINAKKSSARVNLMGSCVIFHYAVIRWY